MATGYSEVQSGRVVEAVIDDLRTTVAAEIIYMTTDTDMLIGQKLRIMFVSRAPFFGGAEQALERLACELMRVGHTVLVVLGENNDVLNRMREAGLECQVCALPQRDKWQWLKYRQARHELRKVVTGFGPSVVHANDLPTHQIVSDTVRGLNVPHVCHHRFAYSGEAIDWFNKYGAKHHLFVSNAFMDQVCARSARLAKSSRAVVHDGLPLPTLPCDNDIIEVRREFELDTDKVIVTFTGQVIERKGVKDLLEAWAQLDAHVRNMAELVIVGDDLPNNGRYRLEMEKLAARLGINVQFTGFRDDVDKWLIASDIVILPSHEEPLGLTIMEAMAYGLATVGSRVGGIVEMIIDEQTGLLVDAGDTALLADAISRLICDGELRQQLGKRARRQCEEHFSIEAHAQNILHEYAKILACERNGVCA